MWKCILYVLIHYKMYNILNNFLDITVIISFQSKK